MKNALSIFTLIALFLTLTPGAYAQDDPTTEILKSGLVGAGSGALASGMSGGNAGKGALIGAGTSVIGSVLLDVITGGGRRRQDRYYDDQYYPPQEELDDYYDYPQEDHSTKVIKGGLVGAGAGALAAGVSGGNAGQGALIGAGTNVIGNALLDSITRPQQQRRGRSYRRREPVTQAAPQQPRTKTIRKYDENGNLIYEEIIPID
jgi:hypothetical protein